MLMTTIQQITILMRLPVEKMFILHGRTVPKKKKEDSSISEVAQNCEIAVKKKFDTDINEFSSTTVLTENDYADVKPSLAVDGDTVYAAWLTNSEEIL